VGTNAEFSGLQVDSRSIQKGELFCAVKGERSDGHDFVANAIRAGAAGALVERNPRPETSVSHSLEAEHERMLRERFETQRDEQFRPVIVVPSVVGAMATIALHFRRVMKGPVIGVTGSAGKTTVKEMIAAALSPVGDVLKSEGNLNTEYGVPMTWSRFEGHHKSAVIEMAMRGPGQIAHLARMSAPDVGVITSIGSAHIGELGSRDAIASAKAELLQALPAGGTAVIPSDSDYTDFLRNAAPCKVVTVGEHGDFQVIEWRQSGDSVEFATATPKGEFAGMVPGIGEIQAKNAAMALAAADAAGVPIGAALASLKHVGFPEKRMQILHRKGVTIWLDAYNSSPESCKLAIKAFSEASVPGRRFAVLGDMLELGEFSEALHKEVGATVTDTVSELALVGELAPLIGEGAREAGFQGEVSYYDDAITARQVFERTRAGDAVLIKASRGLALERILEEPDA
jgi:UDP-N-acetylmuramoyl-tripeptide--D-alanyl-D-alanine ligase